MTSPDELYIICTTPRSGSWLLSEALAATGVAGNPREWFNEKEEERIRDEAGLAPEHGKYQIAYLGRIRDLGRTNNGIWGLKLHYEHFASLPARFRADASISELSCDELLCHLFPSARYIWLTRQNKVRQALSYHRALQTDEWWSIAGIESPRRPGSTTSATFDADVVERLKRLLVDYDRKWIEFFSSIGTVPLTVTYEDFSENLATTVATVLAWLNVPNSQSISVPAPRLKRQADIITEEWLSQYEHFKADDNSTLTGVDSRNELMLAEWRTWIHESMLEGMTKAKIIETLVQNGISRPAATVEVLERGI